MKGPYTTNPLNIYVYEYTPNGVFFTKMVYNSGMQRPVRAVET